MTHALIAVIAQVVVAFATGDWWLGAAAASSYFMGRELAQAEHRAISIHYSGKRANAPWWVGFQWRAWNAKSLTDWIAPALAVCILAGAVSAANFGYLSFLTYADLIKWTNLS